MKDKFNEKYISSLHKIIKDLSMCIDPTSGVFFNNDTILSLPAISKSLEDVAELLELITQEKKKNKQRKENFNLLENCTDKLILSEEPISISKFTFMINEVCHSPNMKKLQATAITEWLLKNHYLELIKQDGHSTNLKKSTKLGCSIGIRFVNKANESGESYHLNLYDKTAQQFILDNMDKILNSSE